MTLSDTFSARLHAALKKCGEQVSRSIAEKAMPPSTPLTSVAAVEARPDTATATVDDGDFRVRIELELKKLRGGPANHAPAIPAASTPKRLSTIDPDGDSGAFHLPRANAGAAELDRLVAAWPKLSALVRKAILRLADV